MDNVALLLAALPAKQVADCLCSLPAKGHTVSVSLSSQPLSNQHCVSVQENAMFLRMASGLGFAQIGDYVASFFYLFKRRGHR